MLLYGRGTENRTLIGGLKVRYSSFELYPLCFSCLRIALLDLRWQPAFRKRAALTSGLRGFIIFPKLVERAWRIELRDLQLGRLLDALCPSIPAYFFSSNL